MITNVCILVFSSLCIAYAGLNVYAAIRADHIIFPAPPSSYQDDEQVLKLKVRDDTSISAYFLKAKKSDRLLIYSHGNGEDIGQIHPLLKDFQHLGTSVLVYTNPA